MNSEKLLISFWNVCLDNLPEGTFIRRRITPDDARRYIEQARLANALLGVSDDDLLATYHERERENHKALCKALAEHFGIALSLMDFLTEDEEDGDPLYSVNPLNCVQVSDGARLLVVTCAYVLGKTKKKGAPLFEIAPTTVEFHLLEAERANAMPMKNPPHPGDFIRTEIIIPAGLTVTAAAAAALHVSRPALSSLLNGKADLSGDMALRIDKAFGVKMDTLMRMQSSYDIAQTRKREKQIHVRRIHRPANAHA
jgi:addiction module HigA family antidote